ncbi:F-box/kelch-repeat protein [Melia azedarach]|uniref:F-box/kelch-repeat protein n=1 Tax=Melia azedarach TaxID=155640 RepID=A0ACC1YZQ4_MELAZ|nr:F-box/kelch-repeat protein [Melia azedarach]
MSDHNPYPNFTTLSTDSTDQILSLLPLPTLIRASTVCKSWRSIISAPSFNTHNNNQPWFFLFGLHNTSSKNNQSLAFDPTSNSWFHLPPTQQSPPGSCLIGANGFFFTTTPNFSFSRIFKTSWHVTSPLRFPRINPLVGVFYDDESVSASGFGSNLPRFIVVGGVRFIGGLVDIEDRLAVEIYDPNMDSWELCPPLPVDFRLASSSQYLSSALFKGRFYVFGIYSCFVSSFDLKKHVWSEVQTLRPPGVIFSFLIACKNMLVLAGMCNAPRGPSFNLWKIDENSMEFSEIAIMPHNFLYSLVDSEEDDKFASLKCVGLGNLIYVFNEEYHKKYPACVCEIDSKSGKCSWRRVPQLPSPVNEFHKVISFCSTVSLQNLLQHE